MGLKRLVVKTKNLVPCGLHIKFLPLSISDLVMNLCSIVEREVEMDGGRWWSNGWYTPHTHLETHLPAPVSDREEKVALSVPSPEEFIPHLVPNVEKVVSVFTCILEQVMWKWSARPLQTRKDRGEGTQLVDNHQNWHISPFTLT